MALQLIDTIHQVLRMLLGPPAATSQVPPPLTSRLSVARGGLPGRGLTVACARDVADCRGSVHPGCLWMHRQQQASAAACWRARALGRSRCGLPRWRQGLHSGCLCACVWMYHVTLDL